VPEIPNLFTICNVLDVFPQKKKSMEVGSWLLGSQMIDLPLPIQVLGNLSFKALHIDWQKWGVPSCMKMTRFPISLSQSSICGKK
jgi:hypothetical protein